MPDSANILSVLASLAQSQPQQTNVLQQAAPQPPQMPPPPPVQPQPPIPSADIARAAVAAAPPAPKPRRSLLDTIGRISDVIAKVGGAEALYQPTLDHTADRALALGDHSRKVDADTIKLETDKFELGDKHNLRLGQATRGLKAIQSGGGDINAAWPVIAQQMGLSPETTQSIGSAIAKDPSQLDGIIAAMTDPKYDQSKYGGSVIYGKNQAGHIVAYQPSLGNDAARSILPEGVDAVDPLKFVNTGGATVGVGTRSGSVGRILPNTEAPGKAADRQTRRDIAVGNNRTAVTIAGMPARATAPKAAAGGKEGSMGTANMLLDNIERGFGELHGLKALPNDDQSAVGSFASAIGRTAIGQKVGEQAGNAAAQKRLSIEKDINSLQSEMIKSLPASATRTKFEQEIQRRRMPDPARMSFATSREVIADLRRTFVQAQKDAAVELSPKKTVTPVARPKAHAGWSVVEVK